VLEIGNWVDADQSTGRVIHIPNGHVFSKAQANFTEGFDFIWHEIPVTITFESNWRKAKEILLRIAIRHMGDTRQAARRQVELAASSYYIIYSKFTPVVYTTVKDHHGIVLTIRYLTMPRRRRSTEQQMWEDILSEFAQREDISFAYPTYRLYSQALEGPTRPPVVEDDTILQELTRRLDRLNEAMMSDIAAGNGDMSERPRAE
jgi:small-conductance mechanosensitive channel